jgi:hypothetical protein
LVYLYALAFVICIKIDFVAAAFTTLMISPFLIAVVVLVAAVDLSVLDNHEARQSLRLVVSFYLFFG